jgi:hypothetical protein
VINYRYVDPAWHVSLAGCPGVLAFTYWLDFAGRAPAYSDRIVLLTVVLAALRQEVFFGRDWMRAAAFPWPTSFMVPMPDAMTDVPRRLRNLPRRSSQSSFHLSACLSQPYLPTAKHHNRSRPGMQRYPVELRLRPASSPRIAFEDVWGFADAFVIPLGILRNGFRILVIGLLCVNVGPQMIQSLIHRRGGPVFFMLSLIPFFLVMWWLRKGDVRTRQPEQC